MIPTKTAYTQALALLGHIPPAEFDVFQLLARYGCTRYNINEHTLTDAEHKMFLENVGRRAQHEPLQYILGEWDFMSLTFALDESTLIPRPDTEIVAECAITLAKRNNWRTALDLCTGSGCIAVAVAHYVPQLKVDAVEISGGACRVAQENIDRYDLNKRVSLYQKDVFNAQSSMGRQYDLIIANPPYVTDQEYKELMPELYYEPKQALVAQGDGLEFYKHIVCAYRPLIHNGGAMVFECGYGQAGALTQIFIQNGFLEPEQIMNYASQPTGVFAYKTDG